SRWEGMSLVLLEAMASGCSVVSTDVHGALEALGDASAIVPVAAPAELAAALVRRLRDPDMRAAEGTASRHRCEAAHSLGVAAPPAPAAGGLFARSPPARDERAPA